MNWFLSALVALVAMCAAWVAFQQMVIARRKLNLDLFDRRFTIYLATEAFFISCLNHEGGTEEDTSRFYNATRAAPFLFDDEIVGFLEKSYKVGVMARIMSKRLANPNVANEQHYIDQHNESFSWLNDSRPTITDRFKAAINLADIKAYSVRSVISFPFERSPKRN